MDIRKIFNLSQGWSANLIAAIAIILIGIIVARITNRIIRKVLHELELNRILREQAGVKIPVEEFAGSLAKYLIYFIAMIMALAQLGLQTIILYIILVIVLVILVSFVVLAFKDFIPNITAGFFIHQKGMIKEGDFIQVKDIKGKVISISLVETKIKVGKDIVYIPNSVLTKNEIIKKAKKRGD